MLKLISLLVASGICGALPVQTSAQTNGKSVFQAECVKCHQSGPTPNNSMAPSLSGVYGRKIASTHYPYSNALKRKPGVWDDQALNDYLENPQKYVPGGKMTEAVPDASNRAAIVQYLKSQ
ncbi:c-type cytochrome [Paraburkholderia sp. UYCP14C]|uniref:c-type cytochrome n=1 Tax=Paraburkholderia sp. UYCP14C TaxID=2511130 RepID=UPI00101EE1FC|nr:c-type cytochrome [Paraburkholderia sp. UYCP14C]RZF30005.1 c-type cytochrome [Paraburkholderia sp. UYCP14C]